MAGEDNTVSTCRTVVASVAERLHEEIGVDYTDMIYPSCANSVP